jgi:hypothetical protein
MTRVRDLAVALVVLSCLAAAVTWPMGAHLADRAAQHGDVYFNMWRMEWVAHAMRTPSARLFDGNIFYPERRTLAYSDAMLVEGVIAAPLYWLHVRPVLVHNVMMLGGMVLSGLAMFVLVQHLTASRGAALIAATVFAFAPYRLEHIMHMELQWAMWSPLAFLALHRLAETAKWYYGIFVGACVALQMLSSIYYGLFLAVLLAPASILLLATARRAAVMRASAALLAGAVISLSITTIYSRPYQRTHIQVGDRPVEEVNVYSAQLASYFAVPSGNRVYGGLLRHGAGERRLFPGLVVLVLALAGLLSRRPPVTIVMYIVLLLLTMDLSFGLRGFTYPFLATHVAALRSLRAFARAGIFVLMCVSVLGGYGYARLADGLSSRARRAATLVILTLLTAEYTTAVQLATFPNIAPAVYRVLRLQPRGLVAEFPVPTPAELPRDEPEYSYLSTFHWFPLVNGYSGNFPPSYLRRLDNLGNFPDDTSLAQLRTDGVRYLVLHEALFDPSEFPAVQQRLLATGAVVELGKWDDGHGAAFLYLFRGT